MYVPPHFVERDSRALLQAIGRFPFATLVTNGPRGLQASHVPMLHDPAPEPLGTLLFHVAKANPQWRDADGAAEALAVFSGPHAYVTPSWYAPGDGAAVPTWDYVAVHAYGVLQTFADRERLRALVTRLTSWFESSRQPAWSVEDAREADVDRMLGAIIGVEMPVSRLLGAWKLSQNRSSADRQRVEQELLASDAPSDRATGEEMRRLRNASETRAPK